MCHSLPASVQFYHHYKVMEEAEEASASSASSVSSALSTYSTSNAQALGSRSHCLGLLRKIDCSSPFCARRSQSRSGECACIHASMPISGKWSTDNATLSQHSLLDKHPNAQPLRDVAPSQGTGMRNGVVDTRIRTRPT